MQKPLRLETHPTLSFASVCGERSWVRPFLEPFNFVIIRSRTSEIIPCTFSSFPSVPYKIVIVPKSGRFFVSSIELHEELDELNGVDEQHGELGREESSKLACVLDSRWEIRARSSFTSTSREFTLADLSASKETSSSESWLILSPKDKFFTPSDSKSNVVKFTRFTITINPAKLISSSGIFLLRRRPVTRPNVDTTWTTSGILSIFRTPNDDLAGWSSRAATLWISSRNILNTSRMKNYAEGRHIPLSKVDTNAWKGQVWHL